MPQIGESPDPPNDFNIIPQQCKASIELLPLSFSVYFVWPSVLSLKNLKLHKQNQ